MYGDVFENFEIEGREVEHEQKLRRRKNYGKTETDGEVWLPEDHMK